MKCTLELYGKTYESTEFTERQVSLFLAASAGATGINIKDLFEELMGAQQMPVRGLREYSSLASAEADLALVLKRVFPTLERSIESIDTSELIAIVKPMLFALAGVDESSAADIRAKTIRESELVSPWSTPIEILTADSFSEDSDEWEENPHPKVRSIEFPPTIATLTKLETGAIEYAASELKQPYITIECWYQWWRTVVDGDDEIGDATAFEVIEEMTDGFFPSHQSELIESKLRAREVQQELQESKLRVQLREAQLATSIAA